MADISKRKPWPNFWTERIMVKSPAFIDLTGKAPHVLMIFRTKFQMEQEGRSGRKEWVILNDGQLEFRYSEARELGMSNYQFSRAIAQLLDRGFIDVAQPGGQHRPTLYRTSEKWREWKSGTHFFIRQPDRRAHKVAAARSARARRRYVTESEEGVQARAGGQAPEREGASGGRGTGAMLSSGKVGSAGSTGSGAGTSSRERTDGVGGVL